MQKAIEILEEGIKFNPDYLDFYTTLGDIYIKQKNFDKATYYYEQSLEIDANYTYVLDNLGYIYDVQGIWDKAIEYFVKSLNIEPNNIYALERLSNIYWYRLRKYDDAIPLIQKIIFLEPQNKQAYFDLGEVYKEKGDYDNAIIYYKKYKTFEPNSAYVNLQLGEVYEQNKNTQEAIKLLLLSINQFNTDLKNPEIANNPGYLKEYYYECLLEISTIYITQQKNKEMISIYEQQINDFPNDGRLYAELGNFYVRINEPEPDKTTLLNKKACSLGYKITCH